MLDLVAQQITANACKAALTFCFTITLLDGVKNFNVMMLLFQDITKTELN
jgi:hypothetical protein